MKNIITVAALLAAGTAFANAETWTIEPENGITGTFLSGSDKFYSLPATVSGAEDWSISFDFTTDSFASSGDASLGTADNSWGMALISTQEGAYALSFPDSFQVYLGKDGKIVMKVDGNSETAVAGDNTLSVNTTYSFSFAYDKANSSFTTVVKTQGSESALVTKTFNDVSFADFSVLSNYGAGEGQGADGKYYSAPSGAKYTNIVVSGTAVVPEPSAFGLLAGAGALALVAARRRRRKA
ncbi:MAG: PEP-CTERM sorting domain-containing protein [Candidatus Spyradosoma sp.]